MAQPFPLTLKLSCARHGLISVSLAIPSVADFPSSVICSVLSAMPIDNDEKGADAAVH